MNQRTISNSQQETAGDQREFDQETFAHRMLIGVWIGALALFLLGLFWYGVNALFLAFSGILLAIFLRHLSYFFSSRLPISINWALGLVILIIVLLIIGGGMYLAPRLSNQFDQLFEEIPMTLQQVQSYLEQRTWGQLLLQRTPEFSSGSENFLSRLSSVFATTVGLLTNTIIILFTGLFFALNPKLYIDGFTKLFPPRSQERAREVLYTSGNVLWWWLLARIMSMALVGVLVTIGLWLLGIPLALALGVITGILTFVPIIGSTLAVIPSLLVAVSQGAMSALYVLILYLGIQVVESYLITPLVQERAISLPPALIILFQFFLGLLVGPLGVALGTPLLALVIVVIKMLYIEDTLGQSIEVKRA